MALPLPGFDLICLAVPSECLFGELYLISLTCGMVFRKARVLVHFSLQFMQAHGLMSWRSTSQLSIVTPMTLSYTSRLVPRRTLARLMQLLVLNIAFKISGSGCLKTSCSCLLLIGTRHQLAKITIDGITVGHSVIAPQSPVRNLGVWLDSNLSMGDHITKTSSAAFYYLYNIRRIRKYLSKECTETLIHAFISSRLDYCNSLLYGLPAYQIQKLQRLQNSAARLVFHESKFCHITPLLRALHWLPVAYRIIFKILLLTFKAIHKLAPTYISELVSPKDTGGRYYLRSNNGKLLNIPPCKSLSTLGDRSFYMAAPKLWNDLPLFIRNISSVNAFKKALKTHLFQKAFPS